MRSSLARALALVCACTAGASQERVHDPPRFDTDRPAARLHPLPKEDGVFHFVVFGDRTGGPREGIEGARPGRRPTRTCSRRTW